MNQFKILTGHLWLSPTEQKKGMKCEWMQITWFHSKCMCPYRSRSLFSRRSDNGQPAKRLLRFLYITFTTAYKEGNISWEIFNHWNWMPPERTRPIVYMTDCPSNAHAKQPFFRLIFDAFDVSSQFTPVLYTTNATIYCVHLHVRSRAIK